MTSQRIRKGSAFLMAVIVLATLAAWAVSVCSFSGVNLQIAENQCKADGARACAESGMDIMRFWLSRFAVSGNTDKGLVFSELQTSLQQDLAYNSISNIAVTLETSGINVAPVTLDSAQSGSFTAVMTPVGTDAVRVNVTGTQGSVTKTISALYRYGVKIDTVFDYGVATKGPLHLSGNIELDGTNVSVESDVFIESEYQDEALSIIGNSQIAGEVKITNPDAYVTMQGGQASIGGESGDAALDHVTVGHEPPEFPVPNPGYFEPYVANIIDSSTDTSADATFENVRIAAGTNPTFTGNVTLKGVVYIETPNIVTFAGGVAVTGIIVGDGDITDNSGTNQLNFLGTVESHPVTELPDEPQFTGLQDEKNTFAVAPGFHVGFGGNFNTLNGAVAGNGIDFFGNAGGTINGSVINYSDQEMTLSGNNDLFFNRSGNTEIPAGFVQDIVLHYDAESYSEIML